MKIALGPHASPLAREAAEDAEIELVPAVIEWEGTAGPTRGHRVVLRLEASLLARVLASPSVADELTAAVAVAVSRSATECLAELRFAWREHIAVATPFRGELAEKRAVPLLDAVVAFLRVSDPAMAEKVRLKQRLTRDERARLRACLEALGRVD